MKRRDEKVSERARGCYIARAPLLRAILLGAR
jgi:hypothetical protein